MPDVRQATLWRNRSFVLPWLAYVLTGRAAALTVLRFVQYAPNLLLGPRVGRWLDRFGPYRAARRAALAAAAELLLLAGLLRRWPGLPLLLFFAFAVGLSAFAQWMALEALVPDLVEPAERARANARLSLVFAASSVAGPVLGGFLTRRFGGSAGLLADALSFVLLAALFQGIRPARRAPRPPSETGGLLAELAYVRKRRLLWTATLVTAACNLFGAAAGPLALFHLARDLRLGAGAAGLVMGAAAAGNALAGLLLPLLARKPRPATLMPAGILLYGLGVALCGLAPSPWLAGAALLASRFATASLNVLFNTLRQEASDPHHIGRVFALTSMLANAPAAAAAALGWLGDLAGAGT
ncbi:MAG: MFS transporter [Firmicutes bacterium]|nr:MFS transporter [Bacillota bacterium]